MSYAIIKRQGLNTPEKFELVIVDQTYDLRFFSFASNHAGEIDREKSWVELPFSNGQHKFNLSAKINAAIKNVGLEYAQILLETIVKTDIHNPTSWLGQFQKQLIDEPSPKRPRHNSLTVI